MSLPGADELFRTTGGMGLQSSPPRRSPNGSAAGGSPAPGETPRVPAPAGEADPGEDPVQAPAAAEPGGRGADESPKGPAVFAQPAAPARRRGAGRGANRRPSGRERHDEKITVYVSAEELMDLEHARLVLRGEHGLAVDRGRIVREAVAVVLADLESRGDASILVRRLRGR
ncbi:hypothetical protein [Streptomyces gilvosporeus]|uniref:Cobyrinic acid a,c-diamide synthase n=1 Tax=Streptomyces gilvosporeus TaxID=553510 RepID=A0A1V0TPB7_9ACTN|nr:hypothetical protein [Streptomyces gilvosporeus]ARF54638.1 hypothetical protein B1H19_10860 [Streptomyces gilvosporeus]